MGEIPRGIFYAQIREGGADHAVQESERTGTVLVCIQILGPTSVSQKEVILCLCMCERQNEKRCILARFLRRDQAVPWFEVA